MGALRAFSLALAVAVLTASFTSHPLPWFVRGAILGAGLLLAVWSLSGRGGGAGGTAAATAGLLVACGFAHLTLYYLERHVVPYFGWDESLFGHLWPNRVFLAVHIAGGISALVLGPFQIWGELRRRVPRWHRWMGRIYVAGVVVAGLSAYRLATRVAPEEGGAASGVAMALLATAWLVTTGAGLLTILRGRIAAHRAWMLRSYVVTLAFVNLRWFVEMPWVTRFAPGPAGVPWIICAAWIAPLALLEVYLRLRPEAPTRFSSAIVAR